MQSRLNEIYKIVVISVSVLVLGLSPIPAQGAEEKKPQLCQGNYQSEEAAKEQLARFAKSYSNLEQWKIRAGRIRDNILRGAELLPLPKKHDLKPEGRSCRKVVKLGQVVYGKEDRRYHQPDPQAKVPARSRTPAFA